MKQRVTVTQETDSGRNTRFHDNLTNEDMTRTQFVNRIKNGSYDDYYVRNVNGLQTPCSKPDGSKSNNLG